MELCQKCMQDIEKEEKSCSKSLQTHDLSQIIRNSMRKHRTLYYEYVNLNTAKCHFCHSASIAMPLLRKPEDVQFGVDFSMPY